MQLANEIIILLCDNDGIKLSQIKIYFTSYLTNNKINYTVTIQYKHRARVLSI